MFKSHSVINSTIDIIFCMSWSGQISFSTTYEGWRTKDKPNGAVVDRAFAGHIPPTVRFEWIGKFCILIGKMSSETLEAENHLQERCYEEHLSEQVRFTIKNGENYNKWQNLLWASITSRMHVEKYSSTSIGKLENFSGIFGSLFKQSLTEDLAMKRIAAEFMS